MNADMSFKEWTREKSFGLCWDLYTTGQLVDGLQQKKKTGFH